MTKLKVYVTPIGFHDAYVAAPSQKAALAAWDTDANLFARGAASVVDDPKLTAEPLAHPGEVIRRSRGTTAEQLAALPPERKQAKPKQTEPSPAPTPEPPDRSELDAAEETLVHAERRQKNERERLEEQLTELQERIARLESEQADELKRLKVRVKEAKARYDRELKAFEAGT